jgi:hypothetical protein
MKTKNLTFQNDSVSSLTSFHLSRIRGGTGQNGTGQGKTGQTSTEKRKTGTGTDTEKTK